MISTIFYCILIFFTLAAVLPAVAFALAVTVRILQTGFHEEEEGRSPAQRWINQTEKSSR